MSDDPSAGNPRLNYLSHTTTTVDVEYFDMPGGALICLVNETSGEPVLSSTLVLDSGGSGKGGIAIDGSVSAGAYSVTAQDEYGNMLAETVKFYVSGE